MANKQKLHQNGENCLKIAPKLTFATVESYRRKIKKTLSCMTGRKFCLDLQGVEQCDSAGLALLIDSQRKCRNAHVHLQLIGVPQKIEALANFCGVRKIIFEEFDLNDKN